MAIGIEKIMTSKWYGYRWVLPGILTLNIGLFIYVSVLFANQVDMRMELYDKVKEAHISNTIVFFGISFWVYAFRFNAKRHLF
jgi:hypothetical protein